MGELFIILSLFGALTSPLSPFVLFLSLYFYFDEKGKAKMEEREMKTGYKVFMVFGVAYFIVCVLSVILWIFIAGSGMAGM